MSNENENSLQSRIEGAKPIAASNQDDADVLAERVNAQLSINRGRLLQEWAILLVILFVSMWLFCLLSEMVHALQQAIHPDVVVTSLTESKAKVASAISSVASAPQVTITASTQLDWHILVFCSALLLAPVFMLSRIATHIFWRDKPNKDDSVSALKDMPGNLVIDAIKTLPDTVGKLADAIKNIKP